MSLAKIFWLQFHCYPLTCVHQILQCYIHFILVFCTFILISHKINGVKSLKLIRQCRSSRKSSGKLDELMRFFSNQSFTKCYWKIYIQDSVIVGEQTFQLLRKVIQMLCQLSPALSVLCCAYLVQFENLHIGFVVNILLL